MNALRTYGEVTARPITTKAADWLRDMVERWGDDRVCDALEAEAQTGTLSGVISRARDRLAKEDLVRRASETPLELGPEQLMAVVRGELEPPDRPWIYDTRGLSADEYAELLAWSEVRREKRVLVPAGTTADLGLVDG